MRGKTERIDKILEKLLLKKGLTKNIQLGEIREALSQILSNNEKKNIRISHIGNNRLYLYISSSSLLYEIKCFKKDQILEELNRKSTTKISDICFILDNK